MAKKLITLAKALDFKTENEYFQYCADSYTNGNFSQCKQLWMNMYHEDKHKLLEYLNNEIHTLSARNYFINLF